MSTLAAFFHDLNPIIVRLSSDVAVRWYGVAYLTGFLIAYLLMHWLSRRGWLLIPRERIADAMMWMIGGLIVGGRLGYLLVYDEQHLLLKFGGHFPFWQALAINRGGMASHGAMVGVILAAFRVSRGWRVEDRADPRGWKIVGRCSVWHVFDAMALVCPPGLMLGRLANFVNGELLGKVYAPALVNGGREGPWWTIRFPTELLERADDLSAAQASGAAALARRAAPDLQVEDGLRYVLQHPDRFRAELEPLLSSRHPSQLYQAAAEGVVVMAVLWVIWKLQPRRAGLIGCAFLVVYGVLRVVTEFWRLPDAQFGAAGRIAGLSRGQWLSVAMVAVGLVLGAARLWAGRGRAEPGTRPAA